MISPDDTRILVSFAGGLLAGGWAGAAIGKRLGFKKAREWYMEQDLNPSLSIDLFPSTGVGSAQPEGGHHGEG